MDLSSWGVSDVHTSTPCRRHHPESHHEHHERSSLYTYLHFQSTHWSWLPLGLTLPCVECFIGSCVRVWILIRRLNACVRICAMQGSWSIFGTENLWGFLFTGYDLNPASLTGAKKTLFHHRYVEAFKFAKGLKKYIRDPDYSSEDVSLITFFNLLHNILCIPA